MTRSEQETLRERKKNETRRALGAVAMRLFAARGFDRVTVADIAAEANVSRKTVFNYFETKEDLLLSGRQEMNADLVRAIRERSPGQSILAAVHHHTLAVAERMRAVPAEQRAAFREVLQSAPTVQTRWRELLREHEEVLAQVIADECGAGDADVVPAVVASVLGVLGRLAFSDLTGWPGGRRRRHPEVVQAIDRAFELLGGGLARYGADAGSRPVRPR